MGENMSIASAEGYAVSGGESRPLPVRPLRSVLDLLWSGVDDRDEEEEEEAVVSKRETDSDSTRNAFLR